MQANPTLLRAHDWHPLAPRLSQLESVDWAGVIRLSQRHRERQLREFAKDPFIMEVLRQCFVEEPHAR